MSLQPSGLYDKYDLYRAILFKDYDAVKTVVESGVNLRCRIRNQTPLFLAIVNNACEETIKLLISHGANVNAQSYYEGIREIPIAFASRKTSHNDLRILLTAPGLNINLCNPQGQGALFFAAEQDDLEKLELLLTHGANVHIGRSNVTCPFFSSVRSSEERIETIRILLRYGFCRESYVLGRSKRRFQSEFMPYTLRDAVTGRKQKTLELLLQAGFRGDPREKQYILQMCAEWDEEIFNRTRDIMINPLNLKTIAVIAIRKTIVGYYGNLKECYLNQLPIPEKFRNDLRMV